MKRYFVFLFFLFYIIAGYSQQLELLKMNRHEIESIFLQNNLQLIAEKFNIGIADAAIIQARLWDNPNLSISDVNLWSTKQQRDGINDMASSLMRNTEFNIELSQLIQTANKRSKLIDREKASKQIAIYEFEEVLRGLKFELRKSIHEIKYSQSYIAILKNQFNVLHQIIGAYQKQVAVGNIAKSELLRLQSSLIDLENEMHDSQLELEEQEKVLKILLNIDPLTNIEISDKDDSIKNPEDIILSDLLQVAQDSRPDVKQYKSQAHYYRSSLEYEKAVRTPDITVSASYARYGGIWKDFVGFGVSIDLPFFNRNQGNIKAAKLSLDQNRYLAQHQQNFIRHEVATAYSSYMQTYSFFKKMKDDTLFPELDNMLEAYSRNVLSRNISMLEYVDFMESYRSNKQIMLATNKNCNIQFEELQYIVGTDIN